MTQGSTRLVDRESVDDEVHEFGADVLYSWEQSTGTLSYDSARSLATEANVTNISDAKKVG